MLFRHFHILLLSVRMAQPPTYCELLAEIYEENAANRYVMDRFYDDQDIPGFDHDKYEEQEIDDKEGFNQPQGDRLRVENIIRPPPSKNEQGKASYTYNKDIRTTVMNIDGRFREVIDPLPARLSRNQCAANAAIQTNFGQSSATEFAILLARQYKNVTSIKIASLEFENSFYTFSALDPVSGIGRDNTSYQIILDDQIGTTGATGPFVVIPDGNYTVNQLLSQVTTSTYSAVESGYGYTGTTGFTGDTGYFYFNITQNPQTQKLTFSSNHQFQLIFPQTNNNFTFNGLGYNLGLYNLIDNYSTFDVAPYTLVSNTRPDVIQDKYVYIVINDWYQVKHQYASQTELMATLKVPLTVPKFAIQFDNIELDTETKVYYFPQPENVHKLTISVIDAYGNLLDMQGGSYSMSFALTEILQSDIYEKLLQL